MKEAVKKFWPDRPFSRDFGDALVNELVKHITKPAAVDEFRANVKKGK